MKKETFKLIKPILVDVLCRDDIKADDDLGDLGADSLDTIVIIEDVEREFGITIEDEEISEIATVKDLVNCVEKKI